MGKPRHKPRSLPVTLPSTNAVDLFLLAGLPNPLHQRAEEFFQMLAGTNAKVISSPSHSNDGAIYKKGTVDTLLRAGATFAIRRLKNRRDDQSTRPRRIALFYVPSEDDQFLLAAFDFFVFPVPLRDLAKFDEAGRQVRHQRIACEGAIQKGMEVYRRELIGVVQQRVESRKSSEPLLLPPVNFHLKKEHRAKDAFCELTRGVRAWENPLPEGIPEMFDQQRLPDFLRHQETQVIYKDIRGVVFPCCRASEAHGGQEFEHNAGIDLLRDLLRCTYRFGASLPPGFHHDAQFEGGRPFKGTPFECTRNGQLTVSATHTNIYPNDYVRPAP